MFCSYRTVDTFLDAVEPFNSLIAHDLPEKTVFFFLDQKVNCQTLARRLGDLKKRGVVLKPGQTLQDLYKERIPLYEKYAHLTVDVSKTDVAGAVALVQSALATYQELPASRPFQK